MEYIFGGLCEINKRSRNQDSIYLGANSIYNKQAILGIVCDGVGSLNHSEEAGITAIQMLKEWFAGTLEQNVSIDGMIGRSFTEEVMQINNKVYQDSQNSGYSVATTFSSLLIVNDKYHLVHLGDSRIYCYRDGVMYLLTPDHLSEPQRLSDGTIKPILTQSLGYQENIQPYYTEGMMQKGDVFVLCSDGLYRRSEFERFYSALRGMKKMKDVQKQCKKIADFVVKKGEYDNISLVMIKAI